jgi:pentatricopeptide repeat protein
VLPRGRKAQAILAYLALCKDPAVPRQRLLKLLWSKRWDEQARASLRQSLMELRRSIGGIGPGILTIEKDRVSLQADRVWIDGLGARFDIQRQPTLRLQPGSDQLLESLRGVDAAFDQWIESLGHRASAWTAPNAPAADGEFPGLGLVEPREFVALGSNDEGDLSAVAPLEMHETRRLTVGVTPFIHLDPDASTSHLSVSLTREVVGALARFRWFTVRLAGLEETHPLDYRLDGSVATGSDGHSIAIRLVDCRGDLDGRVAEQPIWAHESLVDTALLQEFLGGVAERVIEHVDPEILTIETRRARAKASVDCTAYECLLRAIHLVYSFDRENWERARTLLEQAIAKDPAFGRAYAISAVARSTALSQGWIAPTEAEIETLDAYAKRAIECDPYDSLALAVSAHTQLRAKRAFSYAMPLYQRALQLNPSCGFAWAYSAIAHGYLGETDEAMRRLTRARELMHYDSFGQFLESFDMPIAYCSRDWDRTIALGQQFAARGVRVNNMYKLLVGALCQVGRFDEAREYHRDVMRKEPGFSWRRFIAAYPFGREQDRLSLAVAVSRADLIDAVDRGTGGQAANIVSLPGSRSRRGDGGTRLGQGSR